MSGHSKWSTIKRKKAATDAKRGKLFTKLLKEVQMAAKGGSNPEGNVRLKNAILAAKALSVPGDNIDRAIKRGAGEIEGAEYEEITYEGYGSGGVAFIVKALTDNKNRTAAEVRHAFNRYNGNLGGSNSVAFLFEERGILTVQKNAIDEEKLLEISLEAGAQDIRDEESYWEIIAGPREFEGVRKAVESIVPNVEGELRMVPQTTVSVSGKDAENIIKLMDLLDDLDDIQHVWANFEMDDSEMEALNG